MPARVQIVVEAKDQTRGVFQSITSSFTEMRSALDLVSMGLEKIKQGYDFAKEGAQLEFTTQKFDRLAQTIGTTGDAMLGKLKVATQGTLSDMEAMAMATDLLSLGLTKTEDDTVRLASVVSGLGMDMNQLVLTLANQTTMRFDQLGVSVAGFDEKVKKLKDTGMDANAAFTEAFLQQAEAQLKKVGNAADTTVGQFMRFEAQLKDIKDETKMWAAEIAGPLVGAMATNIKEHREFHETLKLLNPELEKQYQWTQTITPAMQKLVYEYQNNERITNAYTERLNAQAEAYQSIAAEAAAAAVAEQSISLTQQQYIGVLGNVGTAMETYRSGLAEANAALESGKIKAEEHSAKVNQLAADYQEARNQIVLSIVEMKLATDGWTDAELNAYMQVGKELGSFTADQINAANGAIAMADKLIQTHDPLLHTGARAGDAADMLGGFADAALTAGDNASQASGGVGALKSEFNKLPPSGTSWEYNFAINVSGRVPGLPDGFGAGGNTPLCFARGTLITLSDGTQTTIENIRVGDVVRSYSLERREFVSGKVAHIFSRSVPAYLNIDGILVTPEHPFWVESRQEWVKAGGLRRGDVLLRDNGDRQSVKGISFIARETEVYNMEVEGEHNYFAAGVLVHNKRQQGGEVYAGMPTWVGEAGAERFIPASDGRILGHAESLHALSLGGGGGASYGPFYGPVTLQIAEDSAAGLMGMR